MGNLVAGRKEPSEQERHVAVYTLLFCLRVGATSLPRELRTVCAFYLYAAKLQAEAPPLFSMALPGDVARLSTAGYGRLCQIEELDRHRDAFFEEYKSRRIRLIPVLF